MPLLTMENDWIASLEQALSELQAWDANTQQKLDILITHITSLKPKKPIITPNPCPNSLCPISSACSPCQLYPWNLTEIIPTEWPSSTPAKPTFICVLTASLMTRLKLFGPFPTWRQDKQRSGLLECSVERKKIWSLTGLLTGKTSVESSKSNFAPPIPTLLLSPTFSV